MKHLSHTATKPPGLLRKIAAFILAAALVALVLMISAVMFAIILIAGTAAFAYLWWKTRELRKQMRDFRAHGEMMGDEMSGGVVKEDEVVKGIVIEGEVIRVVDPREEQRDEK